MRSTIRLIFIMITAFYLLIPCSASHIKTISSSDGLTNNAIYTLHQDKFGHIWIGTGDGLNIWNGRSLENFEFKDGKNYFYGNQIKTIIPSKEDKILVQTKYGVAELNTRTKDVRFHKELALHSKIAVNKREDIFSINGNNLNYYNPQTETCQEIKGFNLKNEERCVLLTVVNEKMLYIFTDKGSYIVALEYKDGHTPPTINKIESLNLDCAYVSIPLPDSNEHFIITNNAKILSFNSNNQELLERASITDSWVKEKRITGIVSTQNGYYISFLENGVYLLPHGQNQLKLIGIDYGMFSLLKDRNQLIIWMGTDCNGLQIFSEGVSEIRNITYEHLPYNIDMPTRSILVDKNQDLWFGTKGDGLYRISSFNTQTEFNTDNTKKFSTSNSSLLHNSVYSLIESRHGHIWIGTDGKGLNWYSKQKETIHKVKGSESLKNVHCILEQGWNTLWIATDCQGAYKCKYQIVEGCPVITKTDTLQFCAPFNYKTSIFSIAAQHDSTIWFASRSHGVLSYNTKNGKSRILKFPTNYGLGINEVTNIQKGKDLLFATGNGLVIYNSEKDSLIVSPEVPYRTIHTVLNDKYDNIWLATNQGIISLGSNYEYRTSYNRFSRLEVLEYSDGACYDNGEQVFFGGINGFTIIQTNSSDIDRGANTYNPPIHITDFIQNHTRVNIESKLEKGILNIPYAQQNYEIKFSIVDNINISDYSIKWNIKRHDNIWRETATEIINIPSLQPGDYTLQIKYTNKASQYESDTYELPIYIIPPIYKSWWAYVIYILLGIGIVIIGYKLFKQKQRNLITSLKKRYAEEVQKTKVETVNSISEELSMLITFILGLNTQVKQDVGSNNSLTEKLTLMDYNIFKLNNILNILKDTKELSEEIKNPREMLLLPISQLTQNLLEILKANVKARNVQLLYDIEDNIILRTNKDYYQTLFNSLIHKVLPIISGKREIYVNLKKEFNGNGVTLIIKVTTNEIEGINVISDVNETSIHKQMVEKMGGDISYAYIGEEIIITIYLPQHINAAEPNIISKEFEINPNKEFIYLISANKEITTFIGYLLSEKYNIVQFDSNQAAFDGMESKIPAAIIYDYSSLRPNFSEYIEEIRSNKRSRHISVIALTSSLQLSERKECTKLGADLCISFPFNVEYLQAVLEKMIDKRENIAEYFNSPLSVYEKNEGKIIHKEDKIFYQKILDIIHNNISDPKLNASMIAKELGLSLRVMYRKLEGIESPNLNQLVIDTRMKLAVKHLTRSKMSIDEIIYKTGYEHRSTFYRNFKNSYGMTPKEYREQIQDKTLKEFN